MHMYMYEEREICSVQGLGLGGFRDSGFRSLRRGCR